jgi:hypothetical protein
MELLLTIYPAYKELAARALEEARARGNRNRASGSAGGSSTTRKRDPATRTTTRIARLRDVASPVTIRHMEETKVQRRARLRRDRLDREHEAFRQDVAAEGSGVYVAATRRTARRLGALERVLRASGELARALATAKVGELEPEHLQHGEEIINQLRSLRGWLGELEGRIAVAAGIPGDVTSPVPPPARGDDTSQRCPVCGVEVEQPATGARRVYCSPAHRQAAYRARA